MSSFYGNSSVNGGGGSSGKSGVGEDVSGQIFVIDGENITANNGAERFNNYQDNIATGRNSHAEGEGTTASGPQSHAEGGGTFASGPQSHAEGGGTTASGDNSHAEGNGARAQGDNSHAEGNGARAQGDNSHAEGIKTIASGQAQHVQGKYNIEDLNDEFVHIVGNGSGINSRANIYTLDWDGVAWFKGGIKVGGTSADDATELTPGGSAEIFVGSTTPSGYSMWIDPEGMIADGNEVGY